MSAINAPAMTTEDWVTERLFAIGCNSDQITLVINENIDWHDVKFLVDRGCEINTAIAILR